MLVILARLLLALTGDTSEASHERAHCACEQTIYAAVAPGIADEETRPVAEVLATIACRTDDP